MMLNAEDLATKKFILDAKGTFEDMASTVIRTSHPDKYTMLNYEEILDKMCDYIESYVEYKKSGDEKYRGKVLTTTRAFYDNIFMEKRYRKKLTLKQISKTNETFLKGTKAFQAVMEKYIKKQDQDYELQEMLILSNNQYKKLSNVYNDDMKIFMWLAAGTSNMYSYSIDPKLRAAYYDLTTPVIHSAKLKARHITDLEDVDTNDDIEDDEE